jgi:L-aminopeptidase/D-esterase-like protein
VDGDIVFCLATGRERAELTPLSALAASATAAAIRDAVRTASGVPGCPSVSDRAA